MSHKFKSFYVAGLMKQELGVGVASHNDVIDTDKLSNPAVNIRSSK